MVLVDSNIIIYSLNSSSPKHRIAQNFIQKNKENLCVAQQNIFESLRILTHPKFPSPMAVPAAIHAITAITDNLKVITPAPETLFVATEMAKAAEVPGDRIFDVYLAATMLTNDVQTIATDNEKDFLPFKGIKVLNPFK